MEAKDLRIGNYIRDIESQREVYVLTIGKQSSTVKMEFSELTQKFEEYEPIELTEEWLLKLGFDVEGNGLSTYYGSQHDFTIDTDNNKTWKIFGYNGGFKHLYFVHELQNLYFTLTGEELTINEGK